MNWYGNRDRITIPAVEEAFKAHMNWEKTLPSPYFVKESEKILNLMKDVTLQGVTISAPGFYGPQGRVVRIPLAMPDMLERIESFRFQLGDVPYRITNFEMESAPLAGLAARTCRRYRVLPSSPTPYLQSPTRTTTRSSAAWRKSPSTG